MSAKKNGTTCSICGKAFPSQEIFTGAMVREVIAKEIARDHPDWGPESYICRADLADYRAKYVSTLLETEKGDLTNLEHQVLESIRKHELLSRDVEKDFEVQSFGERLSDKMADFGGSWKFIIIFTTFLALWIAMNSLVLFWHPPDPYPFILLNLMLSCLAAIQAPVILMSQNRQEAKDRIRARHDYQVNLKAELEIRLLNEKFDHLLNHQWEHLKEIQEIQLDLLTEMGKRK